MVHPFQTEHLSCINSDRPIVDMEALHSSSSYITIIVFVVVTITINLLISEIAPISSDSTFIKEITPKHNTVSFTPDSTVIGMLSSDNTNNNLNTSVDWQCPLSHRKSMVDSYCSKHNSTQRRQIFMDGEIVNSFMASR